MVIRRTNFFLLLGLLLLIPMVTPRIFWLSHSRKAKGIVAFEGMGDSGDAIKLSYTVVYFKHGKDTVWFNGLGNLRLPPGDTISIRYQTGDPSDAKVDIFASIWGDVLVYGGELMLMLLVVFLHPDVIPRRAQVRLTRKKPFIRIVLP